jgi:hypothetical protein
MRDDLFKIAHPNAQTRSRQSGVRQVILRANGSPSLRRVDRLEASGELKDTEIIIVGWESDRENMNELSKYLDEALRRVRR